MSESTSWFEYDPDSTVDCPACGWSGRAGSNEADNMYSPTINVECPNCGSTLRKVRYSSTEDAEAAAAEGNEAAIEYLHHQNELAAGAEPTPKKPPRNLTVSKSIDGTITDDGDLVLLRERAFLTSALCGEVERAPNLADRRLFLALVHLRRWTEDYFPHDYVAPTGAERLAEEVRVGSVVGDRLGFSFTADTSSEYEQDLARLGGALALWQRARARGFRPEPAWPSKGNVLYLFGHPHLEIRKVGITTAKRLDGWRRRGWEAIETLTYPTQGSLHAAEVTAITRLDQLGARDTPRMHALFQTIHVDGRTEMFDPARFDGGLSALVGEALGQRLGTKLGAPPTWISEPRVHAANKAHQHPDRDQKGAAAKAVATRQANAANITPQT